MNNLYTSFDPKASSGGSTEKKRFRWKLIPALSLASVGLLVATSCIACLGMAAYVYLGIDDRDTELRFFRQFGSGLVLFMIGLVGGVSCLVSGRYWWKERWILAAALAAFGVSLLALFCASIEQIRS